ncbi:hypothetical protein IWQ60_012030, partial [Tieghemiomyces parasiticus]
MLNSRAILPPAPNWYSSQVAVFLPGRDAASHDVDQACGGNSQDRLPSILAYAARNLLVLFDTETWAVRNILEGHKQRVSAVAAIAEPWAPITTTTAQSPVVPTSLTYLASGGADCAVKLWDYPSGQLIASHDHHQAHEVTAVGLTDTPQGVAVLSGDKGGGLVLYHQSTGRHARASFHPSAVYVIQFQPRDTASQVEDFGATPLVAAVGHQNGSITVVRVDVSATDMSLTTLYRLEDHSDEIHDLLWLPTAPEVANDPTDATRFSHLVSSSRDKTVRRWVVPEERVTSQIRLPKAKGHYTDHQKGRIWIALAAHPRLAGHVLCSSFMGELLVWDSAGNRFVTKETVRDHPSRAVFSLQTNRATGELYTVSMDRRLCKYDLVARKLLRLTHTLGGHVYALSLTASEPERLAVACGDGTIRLWNFTQPGDPTHATLIWKGLKGKITGVAYHPRVDGLLAYCTDAGTVGVADLAKETTQAFKTYHRATVYSLVWCPQAGLVLPGRDAKGGEPSPAAAAATLTTLPNGTVLHYLISCGSDGQLLVANSGKPKLASVDLNAVLRARNPRLVEFHRARDIKRCEVALDSTDDPRLLTVGNTDGSVEVYRLPDLRLCEILLCHHGWISAVRFKRLLVRKDGSGGDGTADNAPCRWLMAVASSDSLVTIHDVTTHRLDHADVEPELEAEGDRPILPRSTALRTLRGHRQDVAALDWHPDPATPYLVTGSFDSSAIVWDALTGTQHALFTEHWGRCLAVAWDLIDHDIVNSGSDDQTVRRWSVRENRDVTKEIRGGHATFVSRKKGTSTTTVTTGTSKPTAAPHPIATDTASNVTEGVTIAASHSASNVEVSGSPTPVAKVATSAAKKRRKTKAPQLLPELNQALTATAKEAQQQLCLALATRLQRLRDADDKLAQEVLSDQDSDSAVSNDILSGLLFKDTGDIYSLLEHEDTSESHHQQQHLLLLLALSPMAGLDVWRASLRTAAATTYAAHHEPHIAALLYLAVDEPRQAVDVYRTAAKYREALILARLQLPHETHLITTLWGDLATQLATGSHFEQAAQCFLAMGDVAAALDVLSHRSDLTTYGLIVEISLRTRDPSAPRRMLRYAEELVQRAPLATTHRELTRLSRQFPMTPMASGADEADQPPPPPPPTTTTSHHETLEWQLYHTWVALATALASHDAIPSETDGHHSPTWIRQQLAQYVDSLLTTFPTTGHRDNELARKVSELLLAS